MRTPIHPKTERKKRKRNGHKTTHLYSTDKRPMYIQHNLTQTETEKHNNINEPIPRPTSYLPEKKKKKKMKKKTSKAAPRQKTRRTKGQQTGWGLQLGRDTFRIYSDFYPR